MTRIVALLKAIQPKRFEFNRPRISRAPRRFATIGKKRLVVSSQLFERALGNVNKSQFRLSRRTRTRRSLD